MKPMTRIQINTTPAAARSPHERPRRARGPMARVAASLLGLAFAFAMPAAEQRPGDAIADALRRFVADGTVAGAVGLVADRSGILWHEAVGLADIQAKRPMRPDSMFWIASMTKPMTAAAVVMLEEEGRLRIEDPVEKHLPEFRGMWLIASQSKDEMTLARPARAIALLDLLTHTSGLHDVEPPRHDCSLAELAMAYSQKPLLFEPGSRWKYCNPGINTLGRIVEVASGKPYAAFMRERIFDPLGMKDTTFWPDEEQIRRLAKSYKEKEGGGGLEETGIRHLKGEIADGTRTAFPMGGLFSTAADLARFYRTMLNGGEFEGRRLLSPEAVAKMTRTQSGDLATGFVEGMSYGLGFGVVKAPAGVTGMLSPGTFGHGGAHGTQSWADPKKDLIYILMIQRAGLPNGDGSDIRRAFQEAAAARFGSRP